MAKLTKEEAQEWWTANGFEGEVPNDPHSWTASVWQAFDPEHRSPDDDASWQRKTVWIFGEDRIILEEVDSPKEWKARLVVNGDEGEWEGSNAPMIVHAGYLWHGGYYEGYLPTLSKILSVTKD